MVEENLKGQSMKKPPNPCRTSGRKLEGLAQALSPEQCAEKEQFENAWQKKPPGLAKGLREKIKRRNN